MHRNRRAARLALVIVSAVLQLLVAEAASAQPFAVGHRVITYTDPARGNRSIQTEIYYPADTGGESVPVAAGRHPVVVFGHGYLMVWSVYSNIWNALAPSGYIAAFPRTEGSLFPDHAEFGLDLAFLVGKLQMEGQNPASPFFDAVAGTSAVMGHSMGGGASVLAAAANPAITAVANLAAAETNPSAIEAAASVTMPALLFAGSKDCVTPPAQHQIPIYSAFSSTCRALVTITGASHCQFAESNFYCNLGESGCDPPTITRSEQHARVREILLPWLAYWLKGESSGWSEFQALLDAGAGISSIQDCDIISAASEAADASVSIRLVPNRPNPFPHETAIAFEVERDTEVSLSVLDVAGRRVRSLHEGAAAAGIHTISWNGQSDQGDPLPGGIYWIRLTCGNLSYTHKAILIR